MQARKRRQGYVASGLEPYLKVEVEHLGCARTKRKRVSTGSHVPARGSSRVVGGGREPRSTLKQAFVHGCMRWCSMRQRSLAEVGTSSGMPWEDHDHRIAIVEREPLTSIRPIESEVSCHPLRPLHQR